MCMPACVLLYPSVHETTHTRMHESVLCTDTGTHPHWNFEKWDKTVMGPKYCTDKNASPTIKLFGGGGGVTYVISLPVTVPVQHGRYKSVAGTSSTNTEQNFYWYSSNTEHTHN